MKRKSLRVLSYERGYREGRAKGYELGYEAGVAAGLKNSMMPIALVIPASHHLPTLRMMVYQPLSCLRAQGVCSYRFRTVDELSSADLDVAHIIIFVRNAEPEAVEILERAKAMGKRTVYCVDDHFIEIPNHAREYEYYTAPFRAEAYVRLLRNADVVHVNSDYFAELIRQHYNPHVASFPAAVDFAWLDRGQKRERSDNRIMIGYAGTNKEHDFRPVVTAIKRLLRRYGKRRLKFEFFGFVPEALKRYPGVHYIPPEHDYGRFLHKLYERPWDIGLAPLSDTLFNRCKTNNKFREYGACLIPGIYSNMPTYTGWVEHEQTGYLVPHTGKGWYQGMKRMIEDAALRERIRRQASAFSRSHFTIDANAEQWRRHILFGKEEL